MAVVLDADVEGNIFGFTDVDIGGETQRVIRRITRK